MSGGVGPEREARRATLEAFINERKWVGTYRLGPSADDATEALTGLLAELEAAEKALRDTADEIETLERHGRLRGFEHLILVGRRARALAGSAARTESECEHEWVDASNEAVESGALCVKCYALAPAEVLAAARTESEPA